MHDKGGGQARRRIQADARVRKKEGGTHRAHDSRLPVKHVLRRGTGAARGGRVAAEVNQFLRMRGRALAHVVHVTGRWAFVQRGPAQLDA